MRKELEKDLKKKGEYIPQPSWRELQLEDMQEKPHLIFTIYDDEGNVIRKLNEPASKGMKRINWNLRYPSPYAVNANKFDPTKTGGSGWPAMPGTYKVSMQMWHNGELKELAQPKEFKLVKLFEHELTEAEKAEVAAFNQKIMDMVRVTNGTSKMIDELRSKLQTILQTSYSIANAPEELSNQARKLAKELEELNFKMDGVPAKASWEEIPPAQMPISKRVGEVAYTRSASLGAVTDTEKRSYAIVKEEIQPILDRLATIANTELPKLEKELDMLNAPWTPGRIPSWK